jgi:hypothetical protein
MEKISNQAKVDALIDHFWKNGYLTISRKFGKYLPAPQPVGDYEVDAVAKYKKKIAIGLILNEEELNDPKTISKLNFLVSGQNRFSHRRTTLFVGVPSSLTIKAKMLMSGFDDSIKRNIKIIPINGDQNKD